MTFSDQIEATSTYKSLVAKTPFLKGILTKKQSSESIERIVYQIEKFGPDYVSDKNYCARELRIAIEIVENSN